MNVRQLVLTDLDAFFLHRLEGLKNVPTAFGSSYEDELRDGPGFFRKFLETPVPTNVIFAAFEAGKLIGCAGVYQETSRKAQHKCTLWGMYVAPSFSGRGIGKKLVEAVVQHTKTLKDVSQIHLSVEASNLKARSLYLSCGFRPYGLEPRAMQVDGKFYDEEHMVLFI